MRQLRSRLGLLNDHDYRGLFASTTVSQFGQQVSQLAIPLVAVLAVNATEFEVGLLFAMISAAFLLVGLPAGAWVDRLRRRNVLIVGDLARAVLLTSIPVAWWMDMLTIWQLYVVALLLGVFTVFFDVAYQSYLPHLVGRENLVEGNSKLESVRAISQISGPALGGQLIHLLTAPVAILVDAIAMALSAIFVIRIRKREDKPERKPDAHLVREIREGLKFVVRQPLLRRIAMCTGSFNLFNTVGQTMLIVFLARNLGLNAGTIGLFFTIAGIGGLVGALVARWFAERVGQGPAIWMSVAFTTPFGLMVPLAEPGWRLWAAAVGELIVFIGIVVYNVNQVSFRQGLTPDRLLGRMNATMRFLVWGTMPIGAVIGGLLGEWVGAHNTVWIGAIASCLAFLPVFLSPLRTMRTLPTKPEEHAEPDEELTPA